MNLRSTERSAHLRVELMVANVDTADASQGLLELPQILKV